MKPGMYMSMPFEQYLSVDALSSHGISEILKSPAHYRTFFDDPKPPTPAMVFGTAAHCRILENGYCDRYVVKPAINRRTKAGKAQWEAWIAQHPDKEMLSADDGETIELMSARFRENKTAQGLISQGNAEVSLFWRHPQYGFLCKCRIDCLNTDKLWVVDYKTTNDAGKKAFARAVVNYGYDIQAHWYTTGLRAILGGQPTFFFVVQEKTKPYGCKVYQAADDIVTRVSDTVASACKRYAVCNDRNHWPCYEDIVETLELPRWAA